MSSITSQKKNILIVFAVLALSLLSCEAFSPTLTSRATTISPRSTTTRITEMNMLPAVSSSDILFDSIPSLSSSMSSSSLELSAGTLDPTTLLADIFGFLIGTPIILAVPILAALAVAGILVGGIVMYANPEIEDDEINYEDKNK